MKTRLIAASLSLVAVLLAACGVPQVAEPKLPQPDVQLLLSVTLYGAESREIGLQQIKQLEGEDLTFVRDSEGRDTEIQIYGPTLQQVLQLVDEGIEGLGGVRLVAADGYWIDVPADILTFAQIIIAYRVDGVLLDEEDGPLRVFIPGESTMYWVRNLVEIELLPREGGTVPGRGRPSLARISPSCTGE